MSRPLPPHSDAAHVAIAAELVRLTLQHDHATGRPELEHDLEDIRRQLHATARRFQQAGLTYDRMTRLLSHINDHQPKRRSR